LVSLRVGATSNVVPLVYAATSSERSVTAVAELRRQLFRLTLLTAPVAIALALYTARRLTRPIERLRRQALDKATAQGPRAVLDPERADEIGVLADAFNVLLAALEKKRVEHQAFVSDLVHEFKNPVAAVRASADALSSGPLEGDRAARLARVLRDSSGKLDQLVTHVLELARAEAGMPNEERTAVDLAELAHALVARLRDDARYGDVRFSCEATKLDKRLTVHGVPHRLEALLRELLENGASFAHAGGSVRVHVSAVGRTALVSVSDSGPGIAPEDLGRVFDRFFTTRGVEQRGTGLGLALVKAVAEAHGGSVAVRSTPGQGASFEVRLPLA
jgi:signal transduction histidine kinase